MLQRSDNGIDELPAGRAMAVTGRPAARHGISGMERQRRRMGRLFVLPLALVIAIAIAIPSVQALYYSFTDWNGLTAQFVGLSNYADGIFSDPNISRILINNALILASLPLGIGLSFLTAYVLFRGMRAARFFRAVYFLPTAFSWVVIGIAARGLLGNGGGLNSLLGFAGLGGLQRDWLAGPDTALAAIIVTFNWAVFGLNTVILLAGMSTLDTSILDAARLDGCGPVAVLRHIVLPLTRRFIDLTFVITVVAALTQIFALIYVMTSGGPGYSTTTLEFALYQQAFANGSFGIAAAIGVILLVLTLIVAGLRLRAGARQEGRT